MSNMWPPNYIPPYYPPPSLTIEQIEEGQRQLKRLKKALKEDEIGGKKKLTKEKVSVRLNKIFETAGMLMLFSFPVAFGQYLLIQTFITAIKNAIH